MCHLRMSVMSWEVMMFYSALLRTGSLRELQEGDVEVMFQSVRAGAVDEQPKDSCDVSIAVEATCSFDPCDHLEGDVLTTSHAGFERHVVLRVKGPGQEHKRPRPPAHPLLTAPAMSSSCTAAMVTDTSLTLNRGIIDLFVSTLDTLQHAVLQIRCESDQSGQRLVANRIGFRQASGRQSGQPGFTHHRLLDGDVVLKLLQFEASTNVADSKGCFPLHLAAWKGDVEIVRILIHHGPSHCRVNEQNNENETALHCAAQYGHSEVVRVLLEELTDPTMRNSRGETPLDLAALYGRLQVVRMLVNAHPSLMSCSNGRHTPLHLAARNGHRAVSEVLLDAGMDVNMKTEKGSALHEAALFGKMDVVRLLLDSGIDANIRDSHGRTALDILKEHPAQKSQQITALIQEYMAKEMDSKSLIEEPVRHCPVPTPRTSVSSPAASPSLRIKNDAVTGELSKLLNEIQMCRDRDCSFEDLCQTISSHSMESFSSGRHADEQRNGTLNRISKKRSPPLAPAPEEDEGEKSCGPTGLWEALTPCNGCRTLGFSGLSQDTKRVAEVIPSPSLDVFLPEDEDNPFEFVTTAVTRKPCSLDIGPLSACSRSVSDNSPHVTIAEPDLCNHGNSSAGPTPDCSPPSPDTALKNIEKVIRPQPKQRTSLSSVLEVQRPNHSYDPSEVSSSLGYASFSASPPLSPALSPAPGSAFSPANYSIGSAEDCGLAEETLVEEDCRGGHVPEQFAGLLHGSSPACESPDNPYQLYGKVHKFSAFEPSSAHHHGNLLQAPEICTRLPCTGSDTSGLKGPREPKPQVVYRTIFHTRVNQNLNQNPVGSTGTSFGRPGLEERACTLGRMRSIPRNVLDLQLSRNFSKSDSNLISVSPIQEERRSQPGAGRTSPSNRLERTPSFTAEWEEV
ncbi:hypothetical protein Z043_111434 [Scleropages formosus]|uniref:Uncharacterized protein n=1 Tax=Scleropages formosus TaxID=113540 RepID=A0A0N8JZM8_SCLFO|nr:hypothetical protein Z043_111434 [Scleropages formosus]